MGGEMGHKSYTHKASVLELIMYHSFLWFTYLFHLLFNLCFPSRRRIFNITLKPNTKTKNVALAMCLDGLGHLFHGVNFSRVVSSKYNITLVMFDPALAPPNIKSIIQENFPNAELFELSGSYLPKNENYTAVKSSATTIFVAMWCCIKALWQMDKLHSTLYRSDLCAIINMYNHSIGTYHSLTNCKLPMITMAPQFYWLYCGDNRVLHPFVYFASRFCEGNGISIPLSLGDMPSRRFCLPPPLSPSILDHVRSRQKNYSSPPEYNHENNNNEPLRIICYGTLKGHYTVVEEAVKQAVDRGRAGFVVDMFTPGVLEIQKRQNGYLILHPVSKSEYFKYLLTAHAALLSAGEGGPLEAAALGLRLLVVPTEGHDEQALNAALYSEKQLALVSPHFDLIRLLDFCSLPNSDPLVVAQKQAMKKWQDFLLETHKKWPVITESLIHAFNKKSE